MTAQDQFTLAEGVSIEATLTNGTMPRRATFSGVIEIWDGACETKNVANQPRRLSAFFARVRFYSWEFQAVVPFAIFIAWLVGFICSEFFGESLRGGPIAAFSLGFVPVFFLFVLLWPEAKKA